MTEHISIAVSILTLYPVGRHQSYRTSTGDYPFERKIFRRSPPRRGRRETFRAYGKSVPPQ
jgi:hypothetical protein